MSLDYLSIAKEIVLGHVDKKRYSVFLFGSRACDNFHSRSDIDIGIIGKSTLNPVTFSEIEQALSDCIIPYKIDLIDFSKVSDSFRNEALKNVVYWNRAGSH